MGKVFYALAWLITTISFTSCHMTISLSDDASFMISINGANWLLNGPTYFRADNKTHSTADGSLKPDNSPTKTNGYDTLGKYQKVTYTWRIGQHEVQTAIRQYSEVEAVIFSQVFVDGLSDCSSESMNLVVSGFPTFKVGGQQKHVGWMAFDGLFIGWSALKYGRWNSTADLRGGIEAGPFVLFDTKNNVVIISPYSQFMAASYALNKQYNTMDWGVMGEVNVIPCSFQYDTIVYYSSNGINKAMEEWGLLLRKTYARSTAARDNDPTINYIGYYTDNGAYYYHFKEPNKTYEETIKAVVDYAHQMNIPYRYIQLDDWWYPIKGPGYGATVTWTADPKVFPHGLQYIYNLTQWPVVGHNRYWSNITTYAKRNGGRFNFLFDGDMSLPDDQTFWDYLLAGAKEWGLVVYEQDWLNKQVEKFGPLRKNVTLGKRWLHQMGEAATRSDMQLQYCMALPRHLLASVEVPAVSQIRASTDYHLRDNQWSIGVTSIFAHAMGLAPFKDNLWTKREQPGNVYHKNEPHPLLQLTVALLSTGPVGVGDRVRYTDNQLLERLINAEGLLLKPSKPATVIDKQILQRTFGESFGPNGEVWSTYSDISGIKFGIIFCPEIKNQYRIIPQDLNLPDIHYAIYSYTFEVGKDQLKPFDSRHPLTLYNCTNDNFCLYYISPVITIRSKPLVILGEMSKLVPLSPQRITSLSYDTSDVTLTVKGKPGELVTFYFIYNTFGVRVNRKITNLGTAVITWQDTIISTSDRIMLNVAATVNEF